MTEQDTTQNLDVETPEEERVEQVPEETEEAAQTTDDEVEEAPEDEPETFDRPYVEKLRREAADARVRAKDRDTLAAALWAARVAATGRLADPTDLVMPDDADPLDEDAVREQVRLLKNRGVRAIAVCFLHSYRNPVHEQAVKRIVEQHGGRVEIESKPGAPGTCVALHLPRCTKADDANRQGG